MVEPNCSHDISTPKAFFSVSHLLLGALRGHTSYYTKSILFHRKLQSAADLWLRLEGQDRGQRRCSRIQPVATHQPAAHTLWVFTLPTMFPVALQSYEWLSVHSINLIRLGEIRIYCWHNLMQ